MPRLTLSMLALAAVLTGLLAVRDARADSVGATISVGVRPQQAQLNPDGSRLLVSNELSNTVSVISTASDSVIATIPVGTDPGPIRFLPDGSKAYVVNFLDNSVSVINMIANPPSLAGTLTVGLRPITLTVSQDGGKVYAVNEDSNSISVICTGKVTAVCTGTDVVVGSPIQVGSGPWGVGANGAVPHGVGVNPSTNRIYVANSNTRNVSVIDGATNAVMAVVPVGIDPRGVGVNPNTNRVYVANNGKSTLPGSRSVSVIDGATNSVIMTIPFPDGSQPTGVGVNQATGLVYVANNGSNSVSVIDGAPGSPTEHTVMATVPVGEDPTGVGINQVTNRIYVSNNRSTSSNVSVIDGATNAEIDIDGNPTNGITRIAVGVNPRGVAVNPVTECVYVANGGPTDTGNSVSVINGATNAVVGTITMGTGPSGVAFNSANNRIYVANNAGAANTVSVIDAIACTTPAATTIGLGGGPRGASQVGVHSSMNRIYVSNKISNDLSVLNGATGAIAASVSVGSEPHTIAKTPDGAKAYIANQESNNVTVVSTSTNSVMANIPVGPSPGSIQLAPDGTKAYVASRGCADVSICTTPIPPTVSVINTTTNTVTATIPVGAVGAAPHAMRITPDGSKLYVVNKHTNEVKVVSTATNAIIATIPFTTGTCSDPLDPPGDPARACPLRIELTSDGSRAYVVTQAPAAANGSLFVICTGLILVNCGGFSADTVMQTLTLGNKPVDVEINCLSNKAYVTNSGSNSVSAINLTGVPACADADLDGVPNLSDNCPVHPNAFQGNIDADSFGDACDADVDGDGNPNESDPDDDNDRVNDSDEGGCRDDVDSDADTKVDDGCPQMGATPEIGSQCDNGTNDDLGDDSYINDGCLAQAAAEPVACGGDPLGPARRPERIDGQFLNADDDADTMIDEPLPAGTSTNFDCDGDGWKGNQENLIFSASDPAPNTRHDQDPCGSNGWAADLDPDNKLNIGDINGFIAPARPVNDGHGTFNKFGHPLDDTPPFGVSVDAAMARWNLDTAPHTPTTLIDVGDLNAINPAVSAPTARPPMFGGQPAFFTNGGLCPWPP